MKLGLFIRNQGPASTPTIMRESAIRAEDAGLDALWVADHVAIPPDQAEGSNGRYVDPLVTLAWLAGITRNIALGTGVLVLPHRSALATAKSVASVQELSGGRLLLGCGVGAMPEEYRVTGVPWNRRGAITNEILAFLRTCFSADEVERNGQRFLFRPRPARPPIYIGGSGDHAMRRVARHGDGWIAPRSDPAVLSAQIPLIQEMMDAVGKPPARVQVLAALPLDDPPHAVERAIALRELGIEGIAVYCKYDDAPGCARIVDALREHILPII